MEWADTLWDQWLYQVINEVREAIARLEKGLPPDSIWKPHSSQRKDDRDEKERTPLKPIIMEVVELANIQPLPSINDHMVSIILYRML